MATISFMEIGLLGINHKLAPLALREALMKDAISSFKQHSLDYICLTTCNRFEIYFSSQDLAATQSLLLQILCEEREEEIGQKFYSYFKEDCFLHLARVTAGLDSALLFETEIQGQVKRAYQQAVQERSLSPEMHYLFQKSLALGKRIRSHSSMKTTLFSLEEGVESLAVAHLGPLEKKRLLFVGLSEINYKIALYLQDKVGEIVFCNRSRSKKSVLFSVYELDHLHQWSSYDMTLFGTSALDYLLRNGSASGKAHFMVDLSVPRNVHPRIGLLPGVKLVNIEQLHKVVEWKRRGQVEERARLEGEEILQGVLVHTDAFSRRRIKLSQLALVG